MPINGFKTDDPTLDRIEHLCRRLATSLGDRYIKETRWQSFTLFIMCNLLNALRECILDTTPKLKTYSISGIRDGVVIHTWIVKATEAYRAIDMLQLNNKHEMDGITQMICNFELFETTDIYTVY